MEVLFYYYSLKIAFYCRAIDSFFYITIIDCKDVNLYIVFLID